MENVKEFDYLFTNTQTGAIYAQVKDTKREIRTLNDGRYIFISSNKVLSETMHISPIGKPPKYANIFNANGQKEIKEFINH